MSKNVKRLIKEKREFLDYLGNEQYLKDSKNQ